MNRRSAVARWTPMLVMALMALSMTAESFGDGFEQVVRPLLQAHCLRCHGEKRTKGDVNLARFVAEDTLRSDPDLWLRVVDSLVERSMPPPGDRAGPNVDDRERAVASIRAILEASDGVRDPGPSLIQRLTRRQYNNTIRDLLGVYTHAADAFPADGGGGGGFDNNASTLFVPPILMEKYLAAAAEVLEKAEPSRYIASYPSDTLSKEDAARESIEAFARRADRRPVGAGEIDRLMRLYRRADDRGDSFQSAIRLALRGALISPNFLFLMERDRSDVNGPYRVSDHELACRLSYFLWSSMPDDELSDLADSGRLHEPDVLSLQVRRMLADRMSRAPGRGFRRPMAPSGQPRRTGGTRQTTLPGVHSRASRRDGRGGRIILRGHHPRRSSYHWSCSIRTTPSSMSGWRSIMASEV